MKLIASTTAGVVVGLTVGYIFASSTAAADPEQTVNLVMMFEDLDGTWEGEVNNVDISMRECQDHMNAAMRDFEKEPVQEALGTTTLFMCVPLGQDDGELTDVFVIAN